MKLGNDIAAIVSGGAKGLGAAAAEKLAQAGCKVAILDMYREEGEELASRIGGIYRHLEISSEITVDTALDFAREEHGLERILINCAGVALEQPSVARDPDTGRLVLHDIPSFERLLQVNLTGTFYMATKSAAAMMALPPLDGGIRGVIINSASAASEDGNAGQAAYAASEGGVLALTRPLARDLVNEGIRVATIMSGRYDTQMFAERSEDMTQKVGAEEQDESVLANPAEFADLVLNVVSDDSINGQWVRMKGAKQR